MYNFQISICENIIKILFLGTLPNLCFQNIAFIYVRHEFVILLQLSIYTNCEFQFSFDITILVPSSEMEILFGRIYLEKSLTFNINMSGVEGLVNQNRPKGFFRHSHLVSTTNIVEITMIFRTDHNKEKLYLPSTIHHQSYLVMFAIALSKITDSPLVLALGLSAIPSARICIYLIIG